MEKLIETIKQSKAVILITENGGHVDLILKGEKSLVCKMLEKAILNSNALMEVLTTSLSSVGKKHRKAGR